MLYRRGRIYWIEFEHAGQRHRISTHQTNRAAADATGRRLRIATEDRAGPGGRTEGIPLTRLAALDADRANQLGLDKMSQERVESLWVVLLRELGPRRAAHTLTLADVDAYEGKRRESGVSGQTIRREVQALVRGLREAKRRGQLHAMPFDRNDLRRIASDAPNVAQSSKPWTAREIAAVLKALSKKAVRAGWRDRLRLIQLTGMRLGELRRLTRYWLVRSELRIPAAGSKTITGARMIPLSPEAAKIIRRHAKTDQPPFAIGKPNHALMLACKKLKLNRVLTPRDLRAWWITQAGRHDPAAAQKLAGHKSIATTSRYLHADAGRQRSAAIAAQNAATTPTRPSPQHFAKRRKAQ